MSNTTGYQVHHTAEFVAKQTCLNVLSFDWKLCNFVLMLCKNNYGITCFARWAECTYTYLQSCLTWNADIPGSSFPFSTIHVPFHVQAVVVQHSNLEEIPHILYNYHVIDIWLFKLLTSLKTVHIVDSLKFLTYELPWLSNGRVWYIATVINWEVNIFCMFLNDLATCITTIRTHINLPMSTAPTLPSSAYCYPLNGEGKNMLISM